MSARHPLGRFAGKATYGPDALVSRRADRKRGLFGALLALATVATVAVSPTPPALAQSNVPPAVPADAVQGLPEVAMMFDGIPQDGMTLGRRSAPATLWQAEDPQCPVCQVYSGTVLPRVIRRDVRTGRARVRLELFPFIGPDSRRAARFVVAAGRQDRAFQALELVFRNQDAENSGYVTPTYLRSIAQAAGLDTDRVMRDMQTKSVAAAVRKQERSATRHGALGTPTLWTQRGNAKRREVSNFTSALAISRQLAER